MFFGPPCRDFITKKKRKFLALKKRKIGKDLQKIARISTLDLAFLNHELWIGTEDLGV
jgi:hypothetical protein